MKFRRFLFPVVLSASVAVVLALIYVASPAQNMPPLPAASALEHPGTQDSSAATTPARENSSAPSAAAPQTLAQAAPTTTPPASPLTAAEPPGPAAAPPAQAAAPPAQAAAPPAQAPAPAAATPATPKLTQAELDQLLAPIALYPDQLLSQILMASTYPLEIIEAARWLKIPAHRRLKGDALTNALRQKQWDPSVMALVPFPHVLELMDAQIEWTQRLGAAFVAQQADCMDEVQRLRREAIAAGNFQSGPQCRCLVQKHGGYVSVAPANPRIVYAPVYDARVIYGPWLYPAYPPIVFPVPVRFAFTPGFFIGFGAAVNVAYYGPLWGWGTINWGERDIIVNSVRFNVLSGGHTAFAGNVWAHDSLRAGSIVAASAIAAHAAAGSSRIRAPSAAHAASAGGYGKHHHAAAGASKGGHRSGHGGRHGSSAGHGGYGFGSSGHGHAKTHGPGRGHGGPGFGSSGHGHAKTHGGGGHRGPGGSGYGHVKAHGGGKHH